MRMAVFWIVAPCSLVEVHSISNVLSACIRADRPGDSYLQSILLTHVVTCFQTATTSATIDTIPSNQK
jgi:hypothetical protein